MRAAERFGRTGAWLVAVALASLLTPPSFAKQPVKPGPAAEGTGHSGMCEGVHAPLPRGLCVAYCEALDCDAGPQHGYGREKACARIAAAFARRSGGAALPCEISDADGDGVEDDSDDCPAAANPGQEDLDLDAVGDACDNCPEEPNPGQEDTTGAVGIGDACDCPCFTSLDALAIAEDPACPEPLCVLDLRPASLNLSALQCSTAEPVPGVLVADFTDFGAPLCQWVRTGGSLEVRGISEAQRRACRDAIAEGAAAAGVSCP